MWSLRTCLAVLVPFLLATTTPAAARTQSFTSVFPDHSLGVQPHLPVLQMYFPLPEHLSLGDDWIASLPGADIIARMDHENRILRVAAVVHEGTDFLETQLRLAVGGKLHHVSGPVMLGGLPHSPLGLVTRNYQYSSDGQNIYLIRNETGGPVRILRVVDRPAEHGVIMQAAIVDGSAEEVEEPAGLLQFPLEKVNPLDVGLAVEPGGYFVLAYDTDLPFRADARTHHAWLDYESEDGRFSHLLYRIESEWPGEVTWLE